jgi:hypothetical protein
MNTIKNTIQKAFFALTFVFALNSNAQSVAINTDGSTADASAILDLKSTNQGVLVPRLTQSQRTMISAPATGLMVYQTDATAGFYFYNGTAWTSLSAAGATGATGAQGIQGLTGTTGATGTSGTNGTIGATGLTGLTGTAGTNGAIGAAGANGWDGADGTNGANGAAGANGLAGTNGTIGATGLTGLTGTSGTNGQGLLTGGTANQVLAKVNGTDYNTQWVTPSAGGSGATLDLLATNTSSTAVFAVANGINSGDLVTFNNVVTAPTLGSYNTGTNTYTVGVTGVYIIQAVTRSNDGATASTTVGQFLFVDVNSVGIGSQNTILTDYPPANGANMPAGSRGRGFTSVTLYLTAGQTVRVLGLGANSSTAMQVLKTDGSCKFMIVKL